MCVVIFLFCFLIIQYICGELLNPGTYKSSFHPRLRWSEFYSFNKNIDMVFLGSSHAYRSFDPHIFDPGLGITSFNMGSSNQNPVDSYYVLKEVLKYHKPKLVVFEQYYVLASGEDTDFTSATYNFDFMKPSLNKLACLFGEFNPKDYLRAIFRSVRYKDNWNKPEIINQNIDRLKSSISSMFTAKKTDIAPSATETGEIYRGRGYVSNDGVASIKELTINNKFKGYNNLKFNSKRLDYDKRVIELCKKNNIKILLVTAPFPPTSLNLVGDYKSLHDTYQRIADKNGVNYVDYNYINKVKKLFKDNNFKDSDHLNASGVKILDKDLMRYIKPLLQ